MWTFEEDLMHLSSTPHPHQPYDAVVQHTIMGSDDSELTKSPRTALDPVWNASPCLISVSALCFNLKLSCPYSHRDSIV